MNEQEKIDLVRVFLELPDGRVKAREAGLEEMFEDEIQKLKKLTPRSFKVRSILAFDGLSKQQPLTYEQMKAQVERVLQSIKSKGKSNRKED